MLAGARAGSVGDLVSGIRTNEHRMSKSFVHPTLTAAVPGDLSLALPKRQLDDIIEMIYQLDKLAPGTANYDTLLYGAGGKYPPGGVPVQRAGNRPLGWATARRDLAAWPRRRASGVKLGPPSRERPDFCRSASGRRRSGRGRDSSHEGRPRRARRA